VSIKDIIFIIFLIAFGVTFHDWAGAQLAAGGIVELLSLQGGWFGFAIMLIAFLVYRQFETGLVTLKRLSIDIGEGSLLVIGLGLLTIAMETLKTDTSTGTILAGIGIACVIAFLVLQANNKEESISPKHI